MAADLRGLAQRRLALNATAVATMAGAFDRPPKSSLTVSTPTHRHRETTYPPRNEVVQSHTIGNETVRLAPAGPEQVADEAAEPGCNADTRAAEVAIILRDLQAACAMREAALIGAYEIDEVIADREAVAVERLVPDPGTPERDRLDREQAEMVGGTAAGGTVANRHRRLRGVRSGGGAVTAEGYGSGGGGIASTPPGNRPGGTSPRVIAAMVLDDPTTPEADRRAISRVIGWRKLSPADVAMIHAVARRVVAAAADDRGG
jgi:hypothetical protein